MLPLTEIRSPLFGKALVSAGFAVDGGILADSAAMRCAEPGRGSLGAGREARLPQRSNCAAGRCAGPEWHVDDTTYLGFARDLAADDEAELLAIPRKQRAEVRKSLDSDLEVAIGNGATTRRRIMRVFAEWVRNLGTPVFPREAVLAKC